jgi:hypothetical protein
MAKSMMQELFELPIEELEKRWNTEDPEIVGDEMITLTKWIHSNNLMPKVGYESLVGAVIIYNAGSMVSRTTIEYFTSKVIHTNIRLGNALYRVELEYENNKLKVDSICEAF